MHLAFKTIKQRLKADLKEHSISRYTRQNLNTQAVEKNSVTDPLPLT